MNNSINSINMNNNLLEIKNLNMRFGGIVAVSDVSFSVEKGKIITLIGANGAGKSTTLRCIAGIYHPQEGEILMITPRSDAAAMRRMHTDTKFG